MKVIYLSAIIGLTANVLLAGNNLFPNGDFEQFDGNLPREWQGKSWNNEYCKATWNSVSPGRGGAGKAFRINTSTYMTAMDFTAPEIAVESGAVYLFKGYYRFGGRRFDINAKILDAENKTVGRWTQWLPSSQNEWIAFFDEIQIPPTGKKIVFSIKKKQTSEFLELDDFSLRKGTFYDYADEFKPRLTEPGETFPIFCWVAPRQYRSFGAVVGKIYKSPRAYAEYAYANNTIWGDPRFGQKRIIHISELTPELNEESETIFSIHGGDEPRPYKFPTLVKQQEKLKKIAPKLKYTNNLLPVYGFKDFTVYEKYLEDYFSLIKPKISTYDHYAFPANDPNYIWKDYFPNLAIFRKVAKKYNSDYGIIVQLTGFGGCRPATEGDMNFQAYTALAFGCKELGWFTFFEPVGEYDNWHEAVIDTKGNRTYHYAMMRRINAEVLELGKTLLKLDNTGVYFNQDLPRFCQGIKDAGMIERIGGGKALAGEFVNPESGKKYLMIVNRSFTKPAELEVVFRDKVKTLTPVSPLDGKLEETQVIDRGWFNLFDGKIKIKLGVGKGKLYLVNN
jgi:hypothetical protein